MVDFYVSFNTSDPLAKDEAEKVINELKKRANYVGGNSNVEARLIEAEYLIVIFGSEEEFLNKDIAKDYEFFLDELKWKRKKSGVIIMYTPANINFSRVPFKLKNCFYFNYGEEADLGAYITQSVATAKAEVTAPKPVTSSKEIKYTPHPPEVTQIVFSARAPRVESFDGAINYDARETEGCKDDHTYTSDVSDKNKFIAEELDRPSVTSATSSNANKPPKRKNASCGCVVSIFTALLIISIATIFIVVFARGIGNNVIQNIQNINYQNTLSVNVFKPSVNVFKPIFNIFMR